MSACERMPVKITPYKHQLEGWRAALDTLRGGESRGYGLFFEMGCGKSLTAIGIMGSLDIKRALVVAPSSVCPVWVRELNDYAESKNSNDGDFEKRVLKIYMKVNKELVRIYSDLADLKNGDLSESDYKTVDNAAQKIENLSCVADDIAKTPHITLSEKMRLNV